jgi:hypothetical protein
MAQLFHLSGAAVSMDKLARLLLHDVEYNDSNESAWSGTDDSSCPFKYHLGRHSSNR